MRTSTPGQTAVGRIVKTTVVATVLIAGLSSTCCADWRQFRGNDSNAVSSETSLPTSLSGETIAWKVDLPGRGVSSPIIIGDRLFLTSSSGYTEDRLHTLCFDATTGKQLWERQFWATGRTMCHKKMAVATPTPASDGERIFSFYSSNDLTCLDLDGNLLWYRGLGSDYPNASNSLGMSSSPVVVGNTVIVQVESDAEAFAAGLDVKTGDEKWKIDRPRRANWTSPCVLRGDGKDLVLLQSSKGLSAVDPDTGKEIWNFDKGASTIPSSTPVGNTIYVPSDGLTVLKTSATGFEIDWNVKRLSPATASALVYDNKIFTVDRAGVLKCAGQESGKIKWQLRLKGAPFSATPVAGAGMLFFFNEDGKAFIVKPGEDEGAILSEMELGETILATPSIANQSIFVRSDKHLWKISEAK